MAEGVGRAARSSKDMRPETTIEAPAETYKDIVIRSAVIEAEERIHIDGKIRSDLIDQTCIERSNPGLVLACADRVIKFDVAVQIPYDCAGGHR